MVCARGSQIRIANVNAVEILTKYFVRNLESTELLDTVLRQNVASHNVYVTKRNCY